MAVEPSANALATAEEVREWLDLTGAGMDDFLQRSINDWSDAVESRCNRAIKSAEHEGERHDGGKPALLMRNPPVTAIASIAIDGAALGSTDYVFDGASGIVRMRDGSAFDGGPGSVLATYTGGFDPVPGDIRRKIIQIVALDYYLGPGRKALAKRGESSQGGSVTYERGPEDQERIIQGLVRRYGRR